MRPFRDYDIYIFDCDGVLLDSNKIKITAMKDALECLNLDADTVNKCLDYFSDNFGKSRYHHVDFFINNFLSEDFMLDDCVDFKNNLLEKYTKNVDESYIDAAVLPGVRNILSDLTGRSFVASGTEQQQLRTVLNLKDLGSYFLDILGSPSRKVDIVSNVLARYPVDFSAVMIGDSVADFEAAIDNNIDFLGVSGYSNTPGLLKKLCAMNEKRCIECWSEIEND